MLAADAIHDLQVLLAGRDVGYEVEEVVRLARESERVEAPQHEGAVADPRVPVVPVAFATDGLRQRRGGRRQQSPRGAVGEPLQGQSAPLQVALPRVLGKFAPIDPLAPELGRALDPLERLLDGRGRRVLSPVFLARGMARPRPNHRDVGAFALAEHLGGVCARPFEPDPQVGDKPDRHLVLAAARDRLVVALARVLPFRACLPVIEDRLAVEAQLHAADHAARGPQQDVLSLVVGRRTPVGA